MVFDRADWHYLGDYPADLPPQNGGTHIGIFFAWLVLHHMQSDQHTREHATELEAIRQHSLTGREFIARTRGGELSDEDMNDTASAFARAYYDSDTYFEDYAEVLASDKPSLYHAEDTWQSYEAIASRIDTRFETWQREQRPWWRFWQR